MSLRTLLVLTAMALPALAQEPDFVRPGPVFTPEQFQDVQRSSQRNSGGQQSGIVVTPGPAPKCSVPLKNLTPAFAHSKMPTIAPDNKIRFTIKYVAPPAPACEPDERQDRNRRP